MESTLATRAGQKQMVVAEKPEMVDEEKKRGGTGGDGGCKKGSSNGGGSGSSMKCCQAEKCTVDLSDAKQYHRRHKVCEHHAKAPVVVVAGICQRFCQQCSRFHELLEFDEAKRSCRRRLAGHNERRRKNSGDAQVEGPGQRGSGGGGNNHVKGDSVWAS